MLTDEEKTLITERQALVAKHFFQCPLTEEELARKAWIESKLDELEEGRGRQWNQ